MFDIPPRSEPDPAPVRDSGAPTVAWRTDASGHLVKTAIKEDGPGELPALWRDTGGTHLTSLFRHDTSGYTGHRVLQAVLAAAAPFANLRVWDGTDPDTAWSLSGRPVTTAQGQFDGHEGLARLADPQDGAKDRALDGACGSNRQVTEVLEAIYGAVGIYDLDATLSFVSQVTLESTGVTAQEVAGKPITESFWWNADADSTRALRDAIVTAACGEQAHFKARVRIARDDLGRDGFVWAKTTVTPLRDETGAVTQVLGFATDVTGQHFADSDIAASEQRFRQIAETAQIPIIVSEVETGTIHFSNNAARSMIRTALGRDLGAKRTLDLWYDPEDRKRFLTEFKNRGEVESYEVQLRTAQGEPFWAMINASRLDWYGKPCLLTCLLEIDDQRRAESALRSSEARLAGIVEIASDAVIVADSSHRITLFNKGARTIFGYEEHEVLGRHIEELIPPALRAAHERHMRKFISGGEESREMGSRNSISGIRKSGEIFPAEASVARFEADGDQVFMVLLHDVSEWHRREAELEKARSQAEAANGAKSQFIANMSHEIRTPMNGVLGMADALALTNLTPEQQEMLGLIRQSGTSLLTVLNDVLDVSKIESGRLSLEEASISLKVLGARAIDLQRPLAAAKGLEMSLDVDPRLSSPRKGDGHRISQILNNLLSNAVKFTQSGSIRLEITIADDVRDHVLFRVRDTGIGMSDAQTSRVFSPFVQADSSTTRRFGGTGLGLAIVKGLCDRMGGTVSLRSAPGEGTTAEFVLPLPPCGTTDGDSSGAFEATAPKRRRKLPRRRILAAEDNPLNRKVLQNMLSQSGAELTFAEDGAEALNLYRTGTFDMVLMDIQMPVMDGLEALTAIRAFETTSARKATPIYAVTANALEDQVREYQQAGFDGLLTKPLRIPELLALVMSDSPPTGWGRRSDRLQQQPTS